MKSKIIQIALFSFVGGICQIGFSQASVDEFLTNNSYEKLADIKGKKIASGLVIVNGKLIPPPYTIENKGFKLVLNGDVVVFETFQPSSFPPEPPAKKPVLHRKVEEITSVEKLNYKKSGPIAAGRYDYDLVMFYSRKFHKDVETVQQKMAEFYETLPFIDTVESDVKTWRVKVTTKTGKKMDVYGYQRVKIHTDESQRQVTESNGRSLVYQLLSKSVILIDEQSLIGRQRRQNFEYHSKKLFQALVDGVKNSKTEQELQMFVTEQFPDLTPPFEEDFWKNILNNFKVEDADLGMIKLND